MCVWVKLMAAPRIGIIGIGNMGRIHARILHSMRSLAAIADMNYALAKGEGEKYGVEAFDSYEKMLNSVDIDGVIVATPTPTHAEIVESVLKSSDNLKGILIEKPLASRLEDGERVAALLKKKRVIALVSHSEIYNPVLGRALSLIQSGAIGTPKMVIHDRRGFVQPKRIPSLGDVFEDIGVHDFDIMTRISQGPAKVYAQCNSEGGIMNSGVVIINFENGAKHLFLLSREYAGRKRSLDISGTKGTLNLDYFAQIIRVQDLDQEPKADSRAINLPERGATIKVYGEPLAEVLIDFISCIESGNEPRVGIEDGLRALRVVDAARKSIETKGIIDIDITR